MAPQPFLTRGLSLVLDAMRGIAALVVMLHHIVEMGLYTGPYPLGPQAGHNAVIVFFVLSGLVIAHATNRRGAELRAFAIARAARIVPVAGLAVALSLGLYALSASLGQAPALFPPYNHATVANVVLPLVFLSESVVGQGLVWNPPYWSLAYEVWFYALFAAATFLRGRVRLLGLACLVMVAGIKVVVLLPIWATGVALARYGHLRPIPLRAAPPALVVAALVMAVADRAAYPVAEALVSRSPVPLGFSQFAVTDILFGAGVALALMAVRPVAEHWSAVLETLRAPFAWLAGCSFTLYVVHTPVLLSLRGFGIAVGDAPLGLVALA